MSFNFTPPGFDELYTLAAIQEQGRGFNKASAEKSVAQMIKMLTQKNCGEHLKQDGSIEVVGLPFRGNLERVTWELIYQAVSLYMKRQVKDRSELTWQN